MALAVRPAGASRPALLGHDHDARYDARYAPLSSVGSGLDQATADTLYVNVTGGDSMAGPLTISSGGIAVTGASTFSVAPTVGGSALLTQTAGDARYALASALTALTSRVTTLEAQVATLQAQMTGHTHITGTIARAGGTPVMP